MFTGSEQKLSACKEAVEQGVAEGHGKRTPGRAGETSLGDSSRCVNAFRRALRGDPPAWADLMAAQFKAGAQIINTRPRRFDPAENKWLAGYVVALAALGLAFHNLQALWPRLLSVFQSVNHFVGC